MNERIRFQAQSAYREEHGVGTWRGVDPVTGLPVLIYRFRGAPQPGLTRLDSDQLPRLLAWREEDGDGLAVVTFSSAWVAPDPDTPLTGAQLLDSAQALADADAAGVTHGDLTKDRFLIAGDTVVIEGFGMPWQGVEQSTAADVAGWAGAVNALGYPGNAEVDALIARASSPLVSERPSPAALVGELRACLLGGSVATAGPPPPEPSFEADALPEPEDPMRAEPEDPPREPGTREPDPTGDWADFDTAGEIGSDARVAREAFDAEEPEDGPPELHEFRPSQDFASERFGGGGAVEPREPRQPRPPRPMPPAAAPPVVDEDRRVRRIIMLVVLVLLSVVLVVLALRWRGQSGLGGTAEPGVQAAVTYVMDVVVEPEDLPPVDLYVLQSPPGSQLPSDMRLGTAPRRIALDADGTWVFEGRFQGRVSEQVTVNLPPDRASTITITIPPAPQGE